MADPDDDEVKFFQPDTSLAKKLGGAKLDQLFSAKAVEAAQQAIVATSDQFYSESVAEAKKIELAVQGIATSPEKSPQLIREIVASAFLLKSSAGLGAYDLVAKLAKSFHARAELLAAAGTALSPADLTIMQWFVGSLKQLLSLKVKGMGGPVGAAILGELNKLDAKAPAA